MPNLIKIDTQEYPVSLREFRERFKNTSFPVQIPFADFGYAVVFDVPQPIHTRLQRAKELAPEISPLGKYQQVWEVVNLQDEMIPEDYQALLDRFAVEDAAAAAAAAVTAQRAQDLADALPSWQQVSTAIDNAFPNLTQRSVVKKLARVVYWDVKNQTD